MATAKEVAVTIHLPGRTLPATLTTWRPAGHGPPVLVVEGGKSFNGREVAHGPGDVTSYGPACCLVLDTEPGEGEDLLERWEALCAPIRKRYALDMAEEWLDAGGWTDGGVWTQETDDGETRHLRGELAGATLERVEVHYYADDPEDLDRDRNELAVPAVACIFLDGSGVFEIGGRWDAFPPSGRTSNGFVLGPEDRRVLRRLRNAVKRVFRDDASVEPCAGGGATVKVGPWPEPLLVDARSTLDVLRRREQGFAAFPDFQTVVETLVVRAASAPIGRRR